MKNYITVLLVVGAFGVVHSRVTSDVAAVSLTDNELATTCRHEAVPNTNLTVPNILLTKMYECYRPSSVFLRKLSTAPDTDAYRIIFRSACTQEVAVRSCIADVTVEASPCLDDMETKMFHTVKDYVEDSITATCTNDSEVVARVYGEELKPLGFAGQLRMLACIKAGATQTAYNLETDLPAFTLRRYRSMKQARRCIQNIARRAQRNADIFNQFIGALLDSAKCIDAGTHQVVLCNTLEPEQDGEH